MALALTMQGIITVTLKTTESKTLPRHKYSKIVSKIKILSFTFSGSIKRIEIIITVIKLDLYQIILVFIKGIIK